MSKDSKNNKQGTEDPFAAFNIFDANNPIPNDVVVDDNGDGAIPPVDPLPDDDGADDTDPIPPIPDDLKDPEDGDEPDPKPAGDDSDEVSPFKAFASHFGKKGLLEFDEATFEDSEEGLEKVVESTINSKVKAEIDEFFGSMPDELKLMAEFVANGGDPRQFIDVYYNNRSVADLDISDDNNQKLIVSKFLESTGYDQDEIAEALADYEYSGILEKEAKRAQAKLAKAEEHEKAALVQEQKQKQVEQAKQYQAYLENLKTDIEKREEIKGFKLSPSVKSKLYEHITKPVTKDGKTQLMVNHGTNPDAQLLYAYLDLVGWDLSKLEKKVATKVTSDLRKNLGRFTDTKAKVSKGTSEPSLPPDFSAFRGFKL